jgi:hypothetical protein
MHVPYQHRFNHPPDFRVEYRFFSKEEGGRQSIPYQGYRSDFSYEHPDNSPNSVFIIWPEFETEAKEVILYDKISVPVTGTAVMWVAHPEMRSSHKEKIQIGTKGYFMEGLKKVAECRVVEILGLYSNPGN